MQIWECRDGVRFLRAIGVNTRDTVVDFGCRVGHYTIPAALAVGPSGLVYALDKDPVPLDELRRKATRHGVRNIVTMTADSPREVDIDDGSVDVVLLYDVLHYFIRSQRRKLMRRMARLLKPRGLLSVFPKHTADDWPSREFKNLHVSDVMREIQAGGFRLENQHEATLSHDDELVQGCVWNFRKNERRTKSR
jgi:ubiquinone/menaquinone biosynthesis C-methylase UbiE